MSMFKVEVVQVEIEKHPNADKLDIAKVKGWTCVTGRDNFKTGDLAIYLPVDSVLPEQMIKDIGIEKNYHKYLRTIRLRGVISQGMIISLDYLKRYEPYTSKISLGDDLTNLLGITKYDPPIPIEMSGLLRPRHPDFIKYTDIENINNFPQVFKDGDQVVITEKIHGTNARMALLDGDLHVGSHNCDLVNSDTNVYWRAARMIDVTNKLKEGEHIFCEIFGSGIQDLAYGKKDIAVVIFDVLVNKQYLNEIDVVKYLDERDWSSLRVPILWQGSWDSDKLGLANGNSLVASNQIREGAVVKSAMEEYDNIIGGRKILKIINKDYLLRKNGTERH